MKLISVFSLSAWAGGNQLIPLKLSQNLIVSESTGPSHFVPMAGRYRNSIGSNDGIIIAIIITTHIPRNDNAAPDQSCPVIHLIDIVQPPGIGMPPIVDMDEPQTIVTAELAAKSSTDTAKKFWWEVRLKAIRCEILSTVVASQKQRLLSALFIFVITAKPSTSSLISPQARPVQPLIYAPKCI